MTSSMSTGMSDAFEVESGLRDVIAQARPKDSF